MESYLKTLARDYAKNVGIDEIQEYTFVFPNRRAGLFFRKYLAQAMPRAVLAPRIMTINDCFYALSDKQLADPIDLLFRVYEAYKEVTTTQTKTQTEGFDKFLFWGKMMLGDFSEIDNHLIENVKDLFTTVRDLKEIDLKFDYLSERQREAIEEFWGEFYKEQRTGNREQGTGNRMEERFLYIWETLWPTYVRLREGLERDGLAYDGMIHREVIEDGRWKMEDGRWEEKLEKHYVFIGFHTLTRSEQVLVERLKAMGRADVVPTPEIQLSEQEITLVRVPSTVGETHEVYRILNENLNENDNEDVDYTRTAVVLPDERMLLPMLRAIPEKIQKVNVTMGYPLSATPIFALLKLLENLRAHHTEAGFYYKDVKAVLGHKYIREILGEEEITIANRVYVQPSHPIFDSETPTLTYLRNIIRLLPEKDSEEIYLVESGLNRLERIMREQRAGNREQGTDNWGLEEKTIFQLITMVLGELSIPYAGEPLEGLQVMGVLETRALDFDNVIITGFNDDLYPGKSRGNSFIPHVLRWGFGLPTSERQDEIFTYNFYRMLTYAKRVWLITNSRADDQHSGEPSRFLAQLQYLYGHPIKEEVVVPVNRRPKVTVEGPTTASGEEGSVQKTATVMERLLAYATAEGRGFSASALNSYLRCPMLFYWQNVAGLRESQEVTEEMQDQDLGTVLHGVMQALYQPYEGEMVDTETIETIRTRLVGDEALVEEVAQKNEIELPALGIQVVKQFAERMLDIDAVMVPYRYVASEKPVKMRLTLHDGREVGLRGFIDRIDERGLSKRLIDYKTGHAETEYESIESLFDATDEKRNTYALQTILYTIMEGGEPHLYSVRNTGIQTLVHERGKSDYIQEDVREPFLEGLRRLIEEVLDEQVPFRQTADTRKCEDCGFRAMCAC